MIIRNIKRAKSGRRISRKGDLSPGSPMTSRRTMLLKSALGATVSMAGITSCSTSTAARSNNSPKHISTLTMPLLRSAAEFRLAEGQLRPLWRHLWVDRLQPDPHLQRAVARLERRKGRGGIEAVGALVRRLGGPEWLGRKDREASYSNPAGAPAPAAQHPRLHRP